jgi:crotonobetainyl-CoA:carnitine CoA-transferase CaiB-like acyl-CoA transferase
MLQDCLHGIRVLDLSQYIPGPFATKCLADLGAEVIKIEPPAGDPMRSLGGCDADGLSPFYKMVNRGKKVLFLNLKSADDADILRTLITNADVLVESYRPGVLARLGFDSETLDQLNPRLVHCALSGFGQNGPYRLRAGHDITYMSIAGMLGVTGPKDAPVMPFPPVADHAGALYATMTINAALVRQQRTGKGAHLDLSLSESALSFCSGALTQGLRHGLEREGDLLNGGAAYYRTYRCADGRFIALGAIEPKFWQAFCTALGKPEWILRQDDQIPQTDLCTLVADEIKRHPLSHWETILHPQDCCFEPVHTIDEISHHPQNQARGLIHHSGTPEQPTTEIAYPCWADGKAPALSPAHQQISSSDALTAWPKRSLLHG